MLKQLNRFIEFKMELIDNGKPKAKELNKVEQIKNYCHKSAYQHDKRHRDGVDIVSIA